MLQVTGLNLTNQSASFLCSYAKINLVLIILRLIPDVQLQ